MKTVHSIAERDARQGVLLAVGHGDGSWTCYEEAHEIPSAYTAPVSNPNVDLFDAYLADLEVFHLATAKAKGYDSIERCMLRAGIRGSEWQKEGEHFALWVERNHRQAYQTIASIRGGALPVSREDFIASLPAMAWPN